MNYATFTASVVYGRCLMPYHLLHRPNVWLAALSRTRWIDLPAQAAFKSNGPVRVSGCRNIAMPQRHCYTCPSPKCREHSAPRSSTKDRRTRRKLGHRFISLAEINTISCYWPNYPDKGMEVCECLFALFGNPVWPIFKNLEVLRCSQTRTWRQFGISCSC